MRLIPSQVLLNAVFPVTLLWSEFSRRIPFSPLLHTVLFTSSFQLDPLTSIPFHPLLQTLFWVTLFPSLPSVSRIPSWSFHRAVLLNTVLLEELARTMPFSELWFATLSRTLFQFEFVRLIPDNPFVTRVVPGHVVLVRDLVQEDPVGRVVVCVCST